MFKNVDINNINIYCGVNECNFLAVEMGQNKNKDIIFHDVNISNIRSNGNIFQFNGNDINIEFDNTKIENSNSYGVLLKCLSENTNISFKNSRIINNHNINKFDNGLILIKNNININIINTEFKSNESFTSGILYFDNIKNFDITMKNSKFSNNHCYISGGVINLIDKFDSTNEYVKSINVDHSEFNGNKADYFGGILYVNVSSTYNVKMTNTNIYNNYAGVAATSHGNDFATHPSTFILNNSVNNKDYTMINSGGIISLILELKDGLGNTVNDPEKYYSDIGVQAELLNNQKILVDNYHINEFDNSFNNGLNIINSIRVFTENTGEYYIHLKSKNNLYNILKTAYIDYKIRINDCNSNSYTLKNNHNLIYCEKPKCNSTCNVDDIFIECVKNDDNNSNNNPNYNICRCVKGKTGKNCQQNDYVNIRVIKDFGKLSLLSMTLGCIFGIYNNILINNIFSSEIYQRMFKIENEKSCSKIDISNINDYINKAFIKNKKFDDFQNEMDSKHYYQSHSMDFSSKNQHVSSILRYYSTIFYVILKKKGNDRTFYFLSVPRQKCDTHKSYTCECNMGKIFKYTDDEIQSINEYANFYDRLYNNIKKMKR
ncbi:hypothetical protein PIROE2DRAFT_10325 [Piromyces sp. E2]|nr:hypothetical protein PIROE2DRAFT_10325 [Piromyces sp. E2]|eukprot:OUM63168.1 hypothetical protein PIROE2DRAFT_10325 [Piromyces sp. E2]